MAAGDQILHTGTTDSTWATVTNWINQTDASNGPPVSDEILLMDERSNGPNELTSGISATGVDLQGLYVTRGYKNRSIGGAGAPLGLSVSNTTTVTDPKVQYFASGGAMYLGESGDVFDNIEIDCVDGAEFYLVDGTCADMVVAGGTVYISSAAVVTNLTVLGGTVIIDWNATNLTTLNVSGGTVQTARGFTTGEVSNGAVLRTVKADAGTIAGTVTVNGGTLDHQAKGTITLAHFIAGVLNTNHNGFDNIEITTRNLYSGFTEETMHGPTIAGTTVPIGPQEKLNL